MKIFILHKQINLWDQNSLSGRIIKYRKFTIARTLRFPRPFISFMHRRRVERKMEFEKHNERFCRKFYFFIAFKLSHGVKNFSRVRGKKKSSSKKEVVEVERVGVTLAKRSALVRYGRTLDLIGIPRRISTQCGHWVSVT